MRVRVILNPAAGRADARAELARGLDALRGAGWRLEVEETRAPNHATRLAAEAVDEGFQAVLVAGGDGTIGEAVNGLVGSEVPLGVLPLGTANVWALEAGFPGGLFLLPGQLLRAARDLARASVRRVDVGLARWQGGQRHFLLWAGAGFDAQVIRRAEPQLKQRWGFFSYVLAGIQVATRFTSVPTHVEIDGQSFQADALLAVVSNAQRYAGLKMTPRARLDDGLLDVTVLTGRHAGDLVAPILGRIVQLPFDGALAHTYAARRGEFAPTRPLPVHLDAELVGETPLSFEVRPRALRVLVPADASPDLFIG